MAQTVLPYSLVDGQKAYAAKLMADMNAILGGLNWLDGTVANLYTAAQIDTMLQLKTDLSVSNDLVKSVQYTAGTGKFVFTKLSGATVEVDTDIEKIPVSAAIVQDGSNYYLRITNGDGSHIQCDVSNLFNAVSFTDGDTVDFTVTENADGSKTVTAEVKDGSITAAKLSSTVLSEIVDLEDSVQSIEGKIPSAASSTNKLVSASEMGDAIEAVEAKQLYATNAQGSFATKAALTAATTFYNADGTVATPTKNDVAYVLADESHSGKSAKYVIASVDPIVWGFVITFSDNTFTQAQMDAINSGVTSAKRSGYDTHVSDSDIHVTAAQKQTWSGKQDKLPAAVLDRFLHTNATTGNLEWKETPKEIALYDDNNIPGTNKIYAALQEGVIPVYINAGQLPERGIYICCGGEYENDEICYYFLRLSGTTVRFYKQKNLLGGEWSGSGRYEAQKALVSGTSIKTINNQSILGSGNLTVSGLPAYTASDNGKFLRVVNGSAAWQTVPSAENSTF